MRGADHVGPGGVDGRMDGEGGRVHRARTLDHLSGVAHQEEIGDADMAEAHAKGVDPEVVGQFGITSGDVSRDSLGKPEATEEPERPSQPLFPVQPLLFDSGECRWGHQVLVFPNGGGDLGHGAKLSSRP
jgi:hypothetical protein